MADGHWVAFELGSDTPHEHNRASKNRRPREITNQKGMTAGSDIESLLRDRKLRDEGSESVPESEESIRSLVGPFLWVLVVVGLLVLGNYC